MSLRKRKSGEKNSDGSKTGSDEAAQPEPTKSAASVHSAAVWKERPIFISSTFRGMDDERDHLSKNGFLRLAEQLRERCHYLTTIDLRQGVENAAEADDTKREMQVLKLCLDEINRSKPFMIALLGDRYGWIPPADRIAAAARDAGLPASVDVRGRSVTELEILYGVLEDPDQRKRSWFYFRTLDRAGMPPEVAVRFKAEEPSDDPASPAGKLKALKKRISREMPERVREYTLRWDTEKHEIAGLVEFDRRVVADLWSDLDGETAAYLRQAPRTWQEADARALADFVAERTRGYVERPAVTDPMLAHALSPAEPDTAWGLVVTSESGGGKSSLFGRVFDALQARAESGELVRLAHAAGIFPMSGQVDRMLKRWVTELAAHLGVADPLEAQAAPPVAGEAQEARAPIVTSEQIEKTFADLLARAAARHRVVILVDALNQFEPTIRAEYMTWLPKPWPENVRFLATAIPGPTTAALKERPGCRAMPVPPISPDEAREIARRYYRERHHRDTNPRVLDALLAKRLSDSRSAHGNPLWLALALQEMNLLEADDFERADREYAGLPGAERMQALQLDEAKKLPVDVSGVYGELLVRAERGWGKAWTDALTGLITVSCAGWRETDLRHLMPIVSGQPWDDLSFAGVRRSLGTHIVQRGAQAQWDFFHATLRETILRRDLSDEAARRRLHALIADHLECLPRDDPLRIGESMFHLLGLGGSDRAAKYIASIQQLQWNEPQSAAALAAAISVLVTAIQSAPDDTARQLLTDWIGGLMGEGDGDRGRRVANAVIFNLNDALAVTGEARTEVPRFRLLQAARDTLGRLALSHPSNANWQRDLSVSQEKIGDVLLAQGDLAGGLKAYRESLAVAERLALSDPTNAGWQSDLSVSRNKIGDVLRAQGDLAGSLKAYRESLGVRERLALSDPTNAGWQSDLSVSRSKIGDVLLAQGDLVGSLKAYRESLGVRERLALSDPTNAGWQRDLSVSQGRIGDVLLTQGDLAGGLKAYRESLAMAERLALSDPTNAGWQHDLSVSRSKIGDVLLTQGDLAGGLKAYRESLAMAERLALSDPSNAVWQRDLSVSRSKIGDVLLAQGDLAGSLKAYRESLDVRERLALSDPTNAVWQRDLSVSRSKIGDVLLAQGDLAGSLKAYRESLGVAERLTLSDSTNAGWQRDLSVSQEKIGDVLRAQGDLTGSLKAYRESLGVRERLALSDSTNAGWQRDLSVSRNKIGDVLRAQGDLAGSLKAYRESLGVRERLALSDPTNAGWQRDLSVSQEKIGDVLRAQGELAGSLKAYRESLGVRERLALSDPSNAGWQRDLFVGYWNLADVAEKIGAGDALPCWGRAYDQLSFMKRCGIILPTDEKYLSVLRQKAGR